MLKQNSLPYKILSCGSQSPDTPIANLTQPNEVWESSRFCTFPQQITIQFQKPHHIEKIQFLAHRYMIPGRIQLLSLDSSGKQPNVFNKHGYVRFSSNEETNFQAREQKTLDVDITCTHMRFLLHKPHQNRMNYFSQVGLQEILLISGKNRVLQSSSEFHPVSELKTNSNLKPSSYLSQGVQDEFISNKIKLLEEEKELAVEEERYDDAQRIKDIMSNILSVQEQVEEMMVKKQRAVEVENYDEAKKIKNQIQRIQKSTEDIIKNYLEGNGNGGGSGAGVENTSRFNSYQKSRPQSQQEIESEIDQDRQDLNEFVESVEEVSEDMKFKQNRALAESEFDREIPNYKEIINYDDRVVPAILNKDKPPVEDEFENSKLPQEPQELDQKSAKQQQMASVFGEDFARRFFSKHWQFRLEAINTVAAELVTPNLSKDKSPSLVSLSFLKVVADGIKSSVFQICQTALTLCQNLINNKSIEPVKGEIQYDNILYEVTKKLADGNVKIRGMAEQLFKMMAGSSLYGVGMCSSMLIKTVTANSKLSNIQIQQRLDFLTYFVNQFGLGHSNVPLSAIEFASNYIYHQSKDIRSSTVDLLVVCYLAGGEDRVKSALQKLKKETAEEITKKIKEVEKERKGDNQIEKKDKGKAQKPTTNQNPKAKSKPKPTRDKPK